MRVYIRRIQSSSQISFEGTDNYLIVVLLPVVSVAFVSLVAPLGCCGLCERTLFSQSQSESGTLYVRVYVCVDVLIVHSLGSHAHNEKGTRTHKESDRLALDLGDPSPHRESQKEIPSPGPHRDCARHLIRGRQQNPISPAAPTWREP